MNLVVSSKSCGVEMAILHATPFFLTQGKNIIAKVRAKNAIGWGAYSVINQAPHIALVEVKPLKPTASPSRDMALSTDLLLQVKWDALNSPENGGAIITSYHLQYDGASNGATWTNLVGEPGSEAVTITKGVSNNVIVGKTYLFRYRG
jgi:hypothetical protein